MSFLSRNNLTKKAKSSGQIRRPACLVRPRLEALEDRWLPSQIITVNSAADDPSGPSGNTVTLRDAINAANADKGSTPSSPDVIQFAIGSGPKTINLGAALPAVQSPVTIDGSTQQGFSGTALITVNGGGTLQLVDNTSAGLTINDLVLTGGSTAGNGGGILNDGTLTLTNCTITGNHAGTDGGGVWNDGTVTASNCTITNNSAGDNGGGIANISDIPGVSATFSLSSSTVSGNSALGTNGSPATDGGDVGDGGGAYNVSGTLTVSSSTISGNHATGTGIAGMDGLDDPDSNQGNNGGNGGCGGGIYNFNGTVTVSASTVSGNTASGTGGAGGFGGTGGAFENVGGNGGDGGSGGGLYNFGSSGNLYATNVTVAGNTASGTGGAGGDGGTGGGIDSTDTGGNGGSGGIGAGINITFGSVYLTYVTVADNTVTGGTAGAGGAAGSGDDGSTVTGGVNGDGGSGGGLSNAAASFGFLSLVDTIVADNTAPAGSDVDVQAVQADYTLIGDGSSIPSDGVTGKDAPADDPIGKFGSHPNPIDPMLGPLGNNGGPTQTLALLAGSPAIAAGTDTNDQAAPGALVTTDQRGVARPQDGNPDIGAFQTPAPTPPAFTSANCVAFTVGTAGNFTVTTSGSPTPKLSESDPLPSGITFTPATGVLSGTPAAGTGGVYTLHFTADNTVGNPATQTFTLTVNAVPAITSGNSATFTVGTAGSFTVTTAGFPAPTLMDNPFDTLPAGVTFNAATGVLSGTPAKGNGGVYTLHFTADNGVGSDATQNFTLTVNEAPAITSAASTTFLAGTTGSFTVTTGGFPAPTLSETGDALPSGVTFNPTTGVLSGTAAAGTGGTYKLHFTAHNGVGADVTQNFTLTVDASAAITSASGATFTVGTAGSFTVTASGFPAPTLSETGATLPSGVTFNPATGVLSGTPAKSSGGVYTLQFTAHNGVGNDATQTFTLTVKAGGATQTSFTSFVSSANVSVPGQSVTFTATLATVPPGGPSPTGSVDFFDQTTHTDLGKVTLAGGVARLTTSALATLGNQTITATYTNTDGNFTPPAGPATLTQQVLGAVRESNGGSAVLYVGGTATSNHISLSLSGNQVVVDFHDGSSNFRTPLAGLTGLVVYDQGNNAHISVGDRVTVPAFLFAGDGSNTLVEGGGGPTVEVGGKGGGRLWGGRGRNVLIAGRGGAHLRGGHDDDILIGGYTDYDTNLAALQAIMTEWNSSDSFALRTASLKTYFNVNTVHDNGVADRLRSRGGQDWFFAQLSGAEKDLLRGVTSKDTVVGIH